MEQYYLYSRHNGILTWNLIIIKNLILLQYIGYKIFYAQFYEFKIVSLWSVMGRFVGAFGMYELRVIGVWFVLRRLLVHPTMLFALGLFVRTAVNRHHNYRRRNLLFLPFQKLYSNSQELLINRFLIESLCWTSKVFGCITFLLHFSH